MASKSEEECYCKVCDIHFNEYKNYQEHVNTKAHAYMVVKGEKKSDANKSDDNDFVINGSAIFCKICDIGVAGIEPFNQHVKGQKHLKKIKNRHFMERLKKEGNQLFSRESPILIKSLKQDNLECISSNHFSPQPVKIYDSFTRNSEEKIFENDIPPTTSDIDSLHQKIKSVHLTGGNKSFAQPNTEVTSIASLYRFEQTYPLECVICEMHFNGQEPYLQHLESSRHKTNVHLNRLFTPKTCEICGTSFTGPEPFKQHMESIKHFKKVLAKSATPNLSPSAPSASTLSVSMPIQDSAQRYWQQPLAQPININIDLGKSEKENYQKTDDEEFSFQQFAQSKITKIKQVGLFKKKEGKKVEYLPVSAPKEKGCRIS